MLKKIIIIALFALPILAYGQQSIFRWSQGGTNSAGPYASSSVIVSDGTKFIPMATSSLGISGSGTVSSVDMTVPLGLAITGNPITTTGTLALTLASGYVIPLTASTSEWATAYLWGDHSLAGYFNLSDWYSTTTDALPEGSTNKYDKTVTLTEGDNVTITGTYPNFTIAATGGSGSGTIGTSSDPVIGDLAQWTGVDTLASVATSTLNINTDDLVEGSNLFYTQARVWSDIWASSTLATILNNSVTAYLWGDHSLAGYLTQTAADLLYQPIGNYFDKTADTSDDITEGSTNLFYTTARVIAELLDGNNAIFGNATTTNATTTTFAVTGTATSTFANGIDIAEGCFAVNGVCFEGGSSGGGSVATLDEVGDVTYSGIADGDILVRVSGAWLNLPTTSLSPNFNALGVGKYVDTASANLDVISEAGGPSTAIRVENDNSGNTAFGSWITGSAGYLLAIKASGALEWSDGTATPDTNLYRYAANVLKTDDSLIVTGGATSSSLGVTGLATAAGSFLAVDPSGNVIATTSPTGGGTSLWSTHANGIYYNSGKVGIGTTPDSSTGLTVSGGISSPMGDDLYNEAFGKNAYIDNTAFNNTTVIGYGASARSGFAKGGNTVIGAWATSTHAANTIIGSNSKSSAGYSVVIGADLSANSANSVLIGSNASISNGATAAIGYSAVADESHSIAIGQGVNTDKQNQFMVGTRMKANAAPAFALQGAVKAYTPRNIFEIVTEWLDLTDETRQARVKFLTGDYTGALEFMRAETKGGTVDVSFLNGNVEFSGNATASGTIYGGALSIGNGTSQAGCLKIRDSDNDGWTYCSALNGTLSCGTTACSGATLTIGGE